MENLNLDVFQKDQGRTRRDEGNPEPVNLDRPPSRRILEEIPEYSRVVAGAQVVRSIDLGDLRDRCSHFGMWLFQAEDLR